MNIKIGMTSNEIQSIFGNPKNIEVTTCGTETTKPWVCTIWEYGDWPYDHARFYFGERSGLLLLNSYKVERD